MPIRSLFLGIALSLAAACSDPAPAIDAGVDAAIDAPGPIDAAADGPPRDAATLDAGGGGGGGDGCCRTDRGGGAPVATTAAFVVLAWHRSRRRTR